MDLKICITDENGVLLGSTVVYQDGSDSEGTKQILEYIENNFDTEALAIANAQDSDS